MEGRRSAKSSLDVNAVKTEREGHVTPPYVVKMTVQLICALLLEDGFSEDNAKC
jgi:hypothetical protein